MLNIVMWGYDYGKDTRMVTCEGTNLVAHLKKRCLTLFAEVCLYITAKETILLSLNYKYCKGLFLCLA